MFRLRKIRAEKHFATVIIEGPLIIINKGTIVVHEGTFYEVKDIIFHATTFEDKTRFADKEVEALSPELIVESFPLL